MLYVPTKLGDDMIFHRLAFKETFLLGSYRLFGMPIVHHQSSLPNLSTRCSQVSQGFSLFRG